NAVNEMETPEINIPKAIYSAIVLAILIYVILAIGAIVAIPFDDIIQNQEYALAAGAHQVLGHWGSDFVVTGALLATSSAISGTIFGASRQVTVIAQDGYFPSFLAKRKNNIPVYAILMMSTLAFMLIIAGSLKVILEFGSVTFLLVSFLMAFANFKIRKKTDSSLTLTLLAMFGLLMGTAFIIYYEATTQIEQLYFIGAIYALLTLGAWLFSLMHKRSLKSL
ncbi:MAG: amino acid permease, partial [Sulfurimonas sp.]|nr:amino acid permease [Sulfurimonas sp.]